MFTFCTPPPPRKSVKILPPLEKTEMTSLPIAQPCLEDTQVHNFPTVGRGIIINYLLCAVKSCKAPKNLTIINTIIP